MMENKIFLSAFTAENDWKNQTAHLAVDLKKRLGGKSCDLAVFFISQVYRDFDPKIFCRLLRNELGCAVSIGCNASGVISDQREVEMYPGISVLAMHLPGVKIHPFCLLPEQIESLREPSALINAVDVYPPDKPHFICLADPMSCDVDRLLALFNEGYKGLPMIGGLASGAVVKAPNWLCLNGIIYMEGAIGVALTGAIEFETIVSQGCRPIGQPFVITKAENNILYELAGRSALGVVQEVLQSLSPKDKALSETSLFVGLAMSEQRTVFKRGDFLVRNLLGFDPANGTLMIGANLKVGQTLQFQLRDAATSEEDLKILLKNLPSPAKSSPEGGILISCCGRGRGLYGKPDHDVQMIQAAKGPLPLAGFFANGEIGPVGSKNYVHGYTSSLVILK
jgi:small ligand-binding sensory domain FIST